jgi:hypothetical protein
MMLNGHIFATMSNTGQSADLAILVRVLWVVFVILGST